MFWFLILPFLSTKIHHVFSVFFKVCMQALVQVPMCDFACVCFIILSALLFKRFRKFCFC